MGRWSWKSFVSGVVLGSVLFSAVSYAAPKALKLVVDGEELVTEVPAQIIDGSTMVPARGLAEALGAAVSWDEEHQTVTVESDPFAKRTGMDANRAVLLASAARGHYWTVASGGNLPPWPVETFTLEGRDYDYRWMGSDLDTKAKLLVYLEQVYTPEAAEKYLVDHLADGSLVLVNGRLAQVNADGGSLMDWHLATAELKEEQNGSKTFLFTVPVSDFEPERQEVKVRFVEGFGWRIDGRVGDVR